MHIQIILINIPNKSIVASVAIVIAFYKFCPRPLKREIQIRTVFQLDA